MGEGLGYEERAVWGFFGTFRQSPDMASPLRVASHSAILCACVCESKIPKMFYLFKKILNSYIELSLEIKFAQLRNDYEWKSLSEK